MSREAIVDEPIVYPRRVLPLANTIAGLCIAGLSLIAVLMYWRLFISVGGAALRSITYVPDANAEFLSIVLAFPSNSNVDSSVMFVAVAFEVTVALFVVAVIRNAFSLFYLGLTRFGLALVQFTSSGTPEDVPIKYQDAAGVIRWMGEKKEYRSKVSSQEAISVFGYGVQYISPAASEIVAPLVTGLLQTGKDGLRRSILRAFLGWVAVVVLATAPSPDHASQVGGCSLND